jgi:putative ABC transport system ATP-binding protein
MLELDEARKLYPSPGKPIHAVDCVSLRLEAGDSVAIYGPSGSGKTTLLLLAAGLLSPDAGAVRFEGKSLGELSKRQALTYRRSKLGFVSQSFNLVDGLTAEENVAVPLLLRGAPNRAARQRARAALTDVGLQSRAERTPKQMSGGEQQRVAVARAIVGDPKLVLADEPTGNLDREAGDQVLKLLSRLTRERTAALMLATHDERAALFANRVMVMQDGRLTEEDLRARATTEG